MTTLYRKSWLPREGFTSDAVGPLLKSTVFNPALTIPLILLARYTKKGSDFASLHGTAYSRLKALAVVGLLRLVHGYLNRNVVDNWQRDDYNWRKEIVLITGGAGGIGGQVVKFLAEKGVTVVVLDVIPMTFTAPSNVHYFKCDITKSAVIASVAADIRARVGSPTVLINNAGVARGKTILDSTEKDNRFTFDVNTISHYLLAREFVPTMVKRNHGMIVTVSSMAAYMALPNMADYAASKSAALAFHEALTTELVTRYNAPKVRTVVVNQGYTRTALFQGTTNNSKFLIPTLEVDSVAQAIAEKVLSGTGGQLVLPGAMSLLASIRNWPLWMQHRARAGSHEFMSKWHGRQVIDVEKDYLPKEKEDGSESGSTVLVPPASK